MKTLDIHWCSLLRTRGFSWSLAVLQEEITTVYVKELGLYPDAENNNTGYNVRLVVD